MTTTVRWQAALAITATLLAASLSPPQATAAGPYEIRAKWTDDTRRLTPAGVDFAFDAIEYVPRLGVMTYGDHLLLRIEHGEPFVTLGIQALHDTPTPTGYGSAAVLADGARLLTRTTMRTENGARFRETVVVQLDDEGRRETPFAFPTPSNAAAWTSVRLFTDADGQIFAYAGRRSPKTVPVDLVEVAPALEQRFYRLAASWWQETAALDPAVVTATDACFVDGALVVVGSRIERDAGGKVTARRGVSAELRDGRWAVSEIPAPHGAEAFAMAGLRCGRSRDRVYALAVAAAPGQAVGHASLSGAPALYRYDDGAWRPVALPEPSDGSTGARVTAFTVDRTGALWLSYAASRANGAGAETLHRYKDGLWSTAALPNVPEVESYTLNGIAFDDDGYGWAIANREGNAMTPESHGILLGYDGNVRNEWALRGWKWNPLRQRWLGLLGNLR
jgi:hypothetical protein